MEAISIRKMRIFLSAVEEKSFTRASRSQNISQPAATIAISQIEAHAGCDLFLRKGSQRIAKLNNSGEEVAASFAKIVSQYESEIFSLKSSFKRKKDTKEILIQKTYTSVIQPSWLSMLRQTFKTYHVDFRSCSRDEIVSRTLSRKACLGIIDGEPCENKADSRTLFTDFAFVVGTDTVLGSRDTLRWKDLPDEGFLYSGVSTDTLQNFQRVLKEVEIDVERYTKVESEDLITKLLASENSVALMPGILANKVANDIGLKYRRISGPVVDIPIRVIMPWGRMHVVPKTMFEAENVFEANGEVYV
ncbi:LysR family transcriptional regulator [uncultured Tateyamaria sp.]|uniref:LysR family transcriptional regulator n=1 Tax=uncultured Tateyamaria sp. TaxID=455651 RepID=UPI0026097814|nr:LysR family transcriptional regulator [uncultured Tateyamaria sp.]